MRMYLKANVLDAARERIASLFDRYPNVVVAMSGGKDSTVVANLSLEVAREKGRLPLRVLFLDQEAEWAGSVAVVRDMMYRPDVEPLWFQIRLDNTNAGSHGNDVFRCWDEDARALWIHERDPIARTENTFGTLDFFKLLNGIPVQLWPDTPTAMVGGLRAEESPFRFAAMVARPKADGVFWAKARDPKRDHWTFYPLYDWTLRDVWKAIHAHGWRYAPVYDGMHRLGIRPEDMRVSSFNHESSIRALWLLQEIEPETFERASRRLAGVHATTSIGAEELIPEELPPMFKHWREYRDWLLERLVVVETTRARMRKQFAKDDREFSDLPPNELRKLARCHVRAIVLDDFELQTVRNFRSKPGRMRTVDLEARLAKSDEVDAKRRSLRKGTVKP